MAETLERSMTDLVTELSAELKANPDQIPFALGFLADGMTKRSVQLLLIQLESARQE